MGLANWISLSLSIKSITIPVAAEVAEIIGADSVLVASIVMVTGMMGAMFGPWILNRFHVYHPFARGISMGTIAHGIGTAEAAKGRRTAGGCIRCGDGSCGYIDSDINSICAAIFISFLIVNALAKVDFFVKNSHFAHTIIEVKFQVIRIVLALS